MIKEIIKQLEPLINGKLIYLSQFGSHLYGLNTENSDLDFRGIYIPTLDDIILKKDKDEINTELQIKVAGGCVTIDFDTFTDVSFLDRYEKVDVKIFSLQKFIQLCSKADTNALDLLFSVGLGINGEIGVQPEQETYADPYGWHIMWKLLYNRNKLINTDKLESPITYAFKQATRFGIKGERYSKLSQVLEVAKELLEKEGEYVRDLVQYFPFASVFDDKHVKIDILKNKDVDEYYLNICGVQHQFNTALTTFINRIEEKLTKEYTSQRTINAKDGNDWKSLSHAIRVLLEVQELLETGNIQFPLQHKNFLLDIKLGKVERQVIDEYFKDHLSGLMECIEQDTLGWKYDEEFWNEFILKEVKNVHN